MRRDTRTDERVDRRGADTPARRHGRVDGRSSTTAITKTRRPRVDGQRSARADWNDFLTFPRDLSVRNSTFKVSPHLRTFFNPKGRKGVFTRSSDQSVMCIFQQKSNVMSSFGLTCKLVAPETSGNAITFPSFVFMPKPPRRNLRFQPTPGGGLHWQRFLVYHIQITKLQRFGVPCHLL